MGKKKTQRQQDFQKVKLKVGRKVLKSQNETKISVKAKQIVIKEQLRAKTNLQEATTRKRLTIPELLVHLAHYNPSMRYEGISGLSELLTRDLESVLANISALLERLSPIFVDKDGNVRRGCRNLLKKLFPLVSVERMEPFFGLPMAHLYCAMTHIDEDIRKDSLEIVDVCLRHYPSLVIGDARIFLDHFLLQISTKKGSGATTTSTLLVSPNNRISTVKWRTEVFKRLVKVFEALSRENGGNVGESRRDDSKGSTTALPIEDFRTSVVDRVTFGAFDLRECLQSRQRATGVQNASGSGLDCAALHEFGETIIPLLINSWVEASPPDDHNLGREHNRSVSTDVFELFTTIATLLKLMLEVSVQLHVETESSLRSIFSRKFLPELAKRFIPFFPLHSPHNRKRDPSLSSDGASSSASSSTAPIVNLVICDILTFDARILLKGHPPSWLQTVFDHLDRFFSVSNLNHASDEELALAFAIVRRCLKSPAFAAKYLRSIFGRVTSAFFKLSIEPQLSFLDFFLEFLTEFSSLLSHEDSFLADKAIQTWLENLPAFLNELIMEAKTQNGNIENMDSEIEARRESKDVDILSLRILHLFALASTMNFGRFFPLSHFFAETLNRDVFLSLTSDARRRVVTSIGHADLDDDAVLSLLAKFLAADYHRMHDVAWETIRFRWAEMGGRDDWRLVALVLAVASKNTYWDSVALVEKRLGVYFVKVAPDESWLELKEYCDLLDQNPTDGPKISEIMETIRKFC